MDIVAAIVGEGEMLQGGTSNAARKIESQKSKLVAKAKEKEKLAMAMKELKA